MSQRRYYLALIGMIVIMVGGTTLLMVDRSRTSVRNPADVVWMERIRRNALHSLTPFRERIEITQSDSPAIQIGGVGWGDELTVDDPVVVNYDLTDPDLPIEVIMAAREDIVKTSEWINGDPGRAPMAPSHARRLFELKDHLWEITLQYVDTLALIYGREVEVPSGKVSLLEESLSTNKRLLEEELDRLGMQPVE